MRKKLTIQLLLFVSLPVLLLASGGEGVLEPHYSVIFAFIALFLAAGKFGGLIERIGMPPVLGELLAGVVLGSLSLFGIHALEPVRSSTTMHFVAELGVVLLLFQVGLESNVQQMLQVGVRSFIVAVVGVLLPFLLGYLLSPLLMPGLEHNSYIFIGAVLTATSVGITARVFKDVSFSEQPEAKIVLGAAVIDDVLGLIILAVVSAMIKNGNVDVFGVALISAKAFSFLGGALLLGRYAAPFLSRVFATISSSTSMKLSFALIFGLGMSVLAHAVGLEPIVGAFAAGLILDSVHFKFFEEPEIVREIQDVSADAPSGLKTSIHTILERHSEKHIDHLLEPIANFLVPVFFVFTGFNVRLEVFSDLHVVIVGVVLTIVAVVGKIATAFVAGNVRRWIVGWGMVPRGEVGLIFATVGKQLGVIHDQEYAIILIVVILSTVVTPPILSLLIKKKTATKLVAA